MIGSQGYNGKLGRVLFLQFFFSFYLVVVLPLYPCEPVVWFSCYVNKKQGKRFAYL